MWLYLIVLAAPSAFAASGDEFYDRLFTRGLAQFNEGNYVGAYASMKIAAFGYLENIPRFQTAEIYMTVAANRLRRAADARAAAVRVVAAERIEKRYASLPLPAEVRKEFEDAARKLLTSDLFTVLRSGGTAKPQPQPPPKGGDITIPAPVIVSPPQPPPSSKPVPTPAPRVTPPAPQPQPRPVQPQPAPVPPAPTQVQTQPRPVPPAPAQVQTQPKPAQPQPLPQPARPASDAASVLADADRAVNRGDLATARSLYRSILDAPQISHATAMRVAEGLYRSRDFAGAIRAFERAGAIGTGEEQYHYYYAVALYESGRYAGAKRELRAALPFIEVTPDVVRYRVKIEGAIE